MVGIRRHSPYAEKDQGFKAPNVLLCFPDLCHIEIRCPSAGGSADGTVWHQPSLFLMHPVYQFFQRILIKVHIGDRGEKPFDHQPPSAFVYVRGVIGDPCQPD